MEFPITSFTPWASLAGGALIGAAAALLLLLNGRIAGVSGVLAGALRAEPWRLAFVLGLPVGLAAYHVGVAPVQVQLAAGTPLLAIAGFAVGLGTQLGSGCTSGHGVCGLARASRRSLVATALFMGTAALTVFAVRHLGAA